MSRKIVSVPSYRHHKGTGQAFVQVKGRRYYLGKWGTPKSKEKYAAFIAEHAVTPTPTQIIPGRQLTIVELCAAYMDYAAGYYQKDGKPTRGIEDMRFAIRVLTPLYGRELVTDFGPMKLLALQKSLADKGRARSCVNKRISCVKRIFKWGVSRQIVPADVHVALSAVEGLKKGRSKAREPRPIRPVADAVVEATMPFLPPIVADMVRFQRLTGCPPRRGVHTSSGRPGPI